MTTAIHFAAFITEQHDRQ